MPRSKSSTTKKNASRSDLAACKVGLPDVPPLYGLKPRKKYLAFAHAEEGLARSRNYWICTVRPDGRPHSIPVWGTWLDGAFYFGTARSSRKALNLAHNPAVSVHLDSGDDVVILEGKVLELDLTDQSIVKKLEAASRAKYKMPLMITPESIYYAVRPHRVLAWTEQDFPNNATRWIFDLPQS